MAIEPILGVSILSLGIQYGSQNCEGETAWEKWLHFKMISGAGFSEIPQIEWVYMMSLWKQFMLATSSDDYEYIACISTFDSEKDR